MELVTHIEQNKCIILLHGDLDASSSILVDKALQAALDKNMKHILVDFAMLNYISAAGIGVFITHLHSLQQTEITLVLYNMQLKIRDIFNVTGMNEFITIVDTKEEACQWCAQKTCN
jgi:anti-sigma B factor antagonist